jgi:outer membrane protein assembly factor BamD (BamD/ComL family)
VILLSQRCCSLAAVDKAKDLYDTAQLEEKQNNKPHATKLYRQMVEEYPNSPYANQAKTRLAELEKAR